MSRAIGRATVPAPRPPAESSPTANARRAMGRATVALPQVPAAPPAPATPRSPTPLRNIDPPPTGPLLDHPPEDTGSLTGAVLRRGHADEAGSGSRTGFVVLTIAGAVLMLVAFGVIVIVLTGDAVGSFFDSMFG